MKKVWTPPVRLVFGAATVLGLFSSLQAYRLSTLSYSERMDIQIGRLVVLNLALWYIPAVFTPVIFRMCERFKLETGRWARVLGAHILGAGAFSLIHGAAMVAVRALLWPHMPLPANVPWATYVQRSYLGNLDWTLMTYAAI